VLTVAGSAGADGALDPDGQCPGSGQVEGVEVDLGHAAVEPDRLVGDRQRQRNGDLCGDVAAATRVWQRQSIVCSDAVRAAEPTAMPRSMSRRLQVGPVNSSSSDSLRSSLEACRNSAQVA